MDGIWMGKCKVVWGGKIQWSLTSEHKKDREGKKLRQEVEKEHEK